MVGVVREGTVVVDANLEGVEIELGEMQAVLCVCHAGEAFVEVGEVFCGGIVREDLVELVDCGCAIWACVGACIRHLSADCGEGGGCSCCGRLRKGGDVGALVHGVCP
eukprot:Plantae.Rhodophyta-Palmaria_palmata.ctg9012.p4 GENE.Plantae.Rhodophyta-Palmaria_palmata.ctg9012~~Plantae.Rhodophyta-Palmaria_palmata.ctg9012.p4  ORF type:complete len:108 (+),score=9.72 Plantae.Rhodophyta-Palmaria_palmata.ctg9012:787-1110(+)